MLQLWMVRSSKISRRATIGFEVPRESDCLMADGTGALGGRGCGGLTATSPQVLGDETVDIAMFFATKSNDL